MENLIVAHPDLTQSTQMAHPTLNTPYARVCAGEEHFRSDTSNASVRLTPMLPDVRQLTRSTVLALDLGTTTGWAMQSRDGQIAHGFVSLKPQRFEGGGMRYLRFKRWLSELQGMTGDIGATYFEEVRRHAGVDAAHVYGGLLATLTSWCEHHNIPYQGVPVGTIKKHATGKGNAGKDEVIAAMRAKGHPVTDDNEADALALLHWAIDTQEA